MSAEPSISMPKSKPSAVSSAISFANLPNLPSNIPVIWSCKSSGFGKSSILKLAPKLDSVPPVLSLLFSCSLSSPFCD